LVLWGIINFSEESQASPMLFQCFLAWALVEVPRYSFYLLKVLKVEPFYFHTWVRYSLFIPLYPVGILGELGCLAYAFPGASKLVVDLPNTYNFVYSHQVALCILTLLYIPGSPTMVNHMWRERQKQLGGGAEKKKPQ